MTPTTKQSGWLLPISRPEFIALAAALMALNALAIDIMLPALQQIGASLGVENENHRQYVISSYIIGFGLGQLVFGPVSDRFGRRGPLLVGVVIYVAAALFAAVVPSFTLLLVLRFIQGVGAAATRVIAISLVRDVVGGRAMAEIMSLIFMVFMVVPIIAPSLGQVLMLAFEWHMIFIAMALGALAVALWIQLRLPETLVPEKRRALTPATVFSGFGIVLRNRTALFYMLASTVIFGGMFGFVNSAQQIFQGIYEMGGWFPILFACIASSIAVSNFANSRLVGRFGMRRLSHGALFAFIAITTTMFGLSLLGPIPLPLFVVLFVAAMLPFGWLGANFNAMAMEPLGALAGTAASVQGFVQTVLGGVIGAGIGQAFDGTVTPLAGGFWLLSLVALGAVLMAEKGQLFRGINQPPRR